MAVVGYARVSTDGQTLDGQHAALKAAGADKVFAEKVSGAKTDRRQLQRAIGALGAGDVLLVTRLDRLARSTRDLLKELGDDLRHHPFGTGGFPCALDPLDTQCRQHMTKQCSCRPGWRWEMVQRIRRLAPLRHDGGKARCGEHRFLPVIRLVLMAFSHRFDRRCGRSSLRPTRRQALEPVRSFRSFRQCVHGRHL
jgi:hypothetical protein